MPDDRTYGFSRTDAYGLLELIGNGDAEFPEVVPRDLGSPGDRIEYTINSMSTSSEPDFIGLKKASVTVRVGKAESLGTTVSVYDHSGCIFDENNMVGYTGWAFWGQAFTLDESKDCDALTPFHWSADNRCCAPDSGTYRECD
jgi:hypothetical protein